MMKYLIVTMMIIAFSGCAITWSSVAVALATTVTVAEDVGGVLKAYKEAKEYLSDNNISKDEQYAKQW